MGKKKNKVVITNDKKFTKDPRIKNNPEAYYKQTPVWLFNKIDWDHAKWSITKYTFEQLINDIIKQLANFETMTWQDIFSASGGKKKGNGSNSHTIPISNLSKEAKTRLVELNLDTYDELVSLRVGNKKRIFGIRSENKLNILWYTTEHDIS